MPRRVLAAALWTDPHECLLLGHVRRQAVSIHLLQCTNLVLIAIENLEQEAQPLPRRLCPRVVCEADRMWRKQHRVRGQEDAGAEVKNAIWKTDQVRRIRSSAAIEPTRLLDGW